MATVEIWDRRSSDASQVDSQLLALDLVDILDALPLDAMALRWSILDLWAETDDPTLDMQAIQSEVDKSARGFCMEGRELRDVADRVAQVIDGVFAAYAQAPPSKASADLRESCEIVVEAIDSTYWRLYARDQEIIRRVQDVFEDVRVIDTEVPIPGQHLA
jgi:hypothetical protein